MFKGSRGTKDVGGIDAAFSSSPGVGSAAEDSGIGGVHDDVCWTDLWMDKLSDWCD